MTPRRLHQIVLLVQRRYGFDHDGEHGVVRNAVSHVCERVWIPLVRLSYWSCASMPTTVKKDGPSPERRRRDGERERKNMREGEWSRCIVLLGDAA